MRFRKKKRPEPFDSPATPKQIEEETQVYYRESWETSEAFDQEDAWVQAPIEEEVRTRHSDRIGQNLAQIRHIASSKDPMRSKYHAGMDRFLNNGIIVVGILLIIVLLIAFLV